MSKKVDRIDNKKKKPVKVSVSPASNSVGTPLDRQKVKK